MNALSIKQPWADMILAGTKTIEYRTWKVNYRGPLLVVSGLRSDHAEFNAYVLAHPARRHLAEARGVAICVVDLTEIEYDTWEQCYAWKIANPRAIRMIPIKGKLGLFHVPDDMVIFK